MRLNENTPWMTLITAILAVLFTVVGGVVTLVEPDTLTFDQYLQRTGQLALAVAALGVGRSIRKGLSSGSEHVPTWLERAPIATITIGAMVIICAVAGGIMTIADPTRLDFAQYLEKMNTFAFAVGLQGAGRALRTGLERRQEVTATEVAALAAPPPPTGDGEPPAVTVPAAPPLAVAVTDLPGAAPAIPIAGHDEADLPSDEDEEAAPPPLDDELPFSLADVYVLDQEDAMPAVVQPTEDGVVVR